MNKIFIPEGYSTPLNVYDMLYSDKFIVVKDAVAQIEEVYN